MSAVPTLTQPPGVGRRMVGRIGRARLASPRALVGGGVLVGAVLVAILAPLLAPDSIHDPSGGLNAPPSTHHWLGTDDSGVDMLSLVIWGARVSLTVGVVASLVAMLLGGAIGLAAGYLGGRTDVVLMRITDYFLVVPGIPLMIAVATIWGPSLSHIIIVIGLLLWTSTARVVRAQVKTLRTRLYVRRARAIGAGHVRIVLQHVLPHLVPLLAASVVLTIASAIFAEAALAFLGLGDPTQVSWGQILEHAFAATAPTNGYWWELVPAGVSISLVVFGCSLVGTALEERFNPRLRASHISARHYRVREQPPADEPAAQGVAPAERLH
jgi:peptide/nickel transport system permease protein